MVSCCAKSVLLKLYTPNTNIMTKPKIQYIVGLSIHQ